MRKLSSVGAPCGREARWTARVVVGRVVLMGVLLFSTPLQHYLPTLARASRSHQTIPRRVIAGHAQ